MENDKLLEYLKDCSTVTLKKDDMVLIRINDDDVPLEEVYNMGKSLAEAGRAHGIAIMVLKGDMDIAVLRKEKRGRKKKNEQQTV